MSAAATSSRIATAPMRVGKTLGFKEDQIKPGWLVPRLGNTYSGASPLGLTATAIPLP